MQNVYTAGALASAWLTTLDLLLSAHSTCCNTSTLLYLVQNVYAVGALASAWLAVVHDVSDEVVAGVCVACSRLSTQQLTKLYSSTQHATVFTVPSSR